MWNGLCAFCFKLFENHFILHFSTTFTMEDMQTVMERRLLIYSNQLLYTLFGS